ncbi:L-asparaginase [Pseudoroseomonas rhizosphaerae]|uniref:L-asparaginase n=1 Tax=Teichococcus rhizosphaerae TaxID=1335062 RepID=A0A2C7ABY7_9PROT|nr:asparaginase [Pseudoroseomonas rhizosphaerae]PHK94925.1 L-asparaginase [Pseudoroseomonas rhizosphaerae]
MPNSPALPRIAFIGTGGTMASLGQDALDIQDYGRHGRVMEAEAILARVPELARVAEVIPRPYSAVISSRIGFRDWKAIALECHRAAAEIPGLAGIVIGHGTSTMEETAYALNLGLKVGVPVVMVGAQRPASGLSSDMPMNLLNAVRTAASPGARGLGVLLLLNDEIHAAREVSKTATWRMQTFRTPDFGVLGQADADRVAFYRRPTRRVMPDTEFDLRAIDTLPRVDIAYSHADADATAIRAFVAAGARGIVSAGFAPGSPTPAEADALAEAVKAGVVVVQSTRVGSGRVVRGEKMVRQGLLAADNLTPQKARILLAMALTVTRDPAEITRIFDTY